MSRDDLRHLLTAAVDGALTPAERKVAQRLVRESAEAKALYLQLKRDAERIKLLRRHAAPSDLADTVLDAIRDRKPTPLPPTRTRTSVWAGWMTLATAAGIVLAVSAGAVLFALPDRTKSVARVPVLVSNPLDVGRPAGAEVGPMPRSVPGESVAVAPKGPELGPLPREVRDPLVSPDREETPEIRGIQLDAIRYSKLYTVRDLPGKADEQAKFLADVKKDELIRLDLFASSEAKGTVSKGTDLVLNALKSRGIEVFADGFAQDRRRKNPDTELVIFTEAMTPAEVMQFLTAIGAEEKRWPTAVFDTLVVAPFLPKDLTQLTNLLGLPSLTKEKADIRKPLPEGTANQVAATLTRMGGSGSTAPAPKTDKVAVLVAYSPANPSPAQSKEIRQFLARRGDRKADAKPLMLVLRSK